MYGYSICMYLIVSWGRGGWFFFTFAGGSAWAMGLKALSNNFFFLASGIRGGRTGL